MHVCSFHHAHTHRGHCTNYICLHIQLTTHPNVVELSAAPSHRWAVAAGPQQHTSRGFHSSMEASVIVTY